MAYLVLARRYRPQAFSELIGQEHIITILTNALNSGRIHHAFLFTGARGTGKTSTARLLAKALNCEKGPTPTPCNSCAHCEDIAVGKEVDVLEIDGATNTGVENVRALREDIRFLPSSGRYRVIIIDEVHMLTVSAFNALLKTLEEPPSHVIFIFATTEPHKIPATILSRVQRFDFRRVDLEGLTNHVIDILSRESFEIEREAATFIALEGEGSVRDTLSILDQILASHTGGPITSEMVKAVLGITDRRVLSDIAFAILNRDGAQVLTALHAIFYEGYDIVHFTKSLVSWFRDLLVIKSVKEPGALVFTTPDELTKTQQMLSEFSIQHLHHLFLRLFNGLDTVSRSLSPKTALELLLMDLVLAEPLLPATHLFDRLSALEGAVKSSTSGAPAKRLNTPTVHRPVQSAPSPSLIQKSPQATANQAPTTSASHTVVAQNAGAPQGAPAAQARVTDVAPSAFSYKEWSKLLDGISKSHGRLFVCLQDARFASSVDPQGGLHFTLVYPEGENTFSLKYLQGQLTEVEELFSSMTGHPVHVKIELTKKESMAPSWQALSPGAPVASPHERERQARAVRERATDETIRANPVVRELLDKLGGTVTGRRLKQD